MLIYQRLNPMWLPGLVLLLPSGFKRDVAMEQPLQYIVKSCQIIINILLYLLYHGSSIFMLTNITNQKLYIPNHHFLLSREIRRYSDVPFGTLSLAEPRGAWTSDLGTSQRHRCDPAREARATIPGWKCHVFESSPMVEFTQRLEAPMFDHVWPMFDAQPFLVQLDMM